MNARIDNALKLIFMAMLLMSLLMGALAPWGGGGGGDAATPTPTPTSTQGSVVVDVAALA